MKKINTYMLASALVALPLVGCSDKTEMVEPVKQAAVQSEAVMPKPVPPKLGTYVDDRVIIDLSPEQRTAVLGMMNEFIYAFGEISGGLADGDRQRIADGVKDSGMGGLKMPRGTGRNFPPEFKEISHATRGAFDEIGTMAKSGATDAEILQKMSEIMTLCSGCHTLYQIPTK